MWDTTEPLDIVTLFQMLFHSGTILVQCDLWTNQANLWKAPNPLYGSRLGNFSKQPTTSPVATLMEARTKTVFSSCFHILTGKLLALLMEAATKSVDLFVRKLVFCRNCQLSWLTYFAISLLQKAIPCHVGLTNILSKNKSC